MNDKQLQAFLVIAEMGSMNKAAEKLYISQPALKKRMDTLEEELGTSLFARDSGGCTLTEDGHIFLEGMQPLYTQMQRVIDKTKQAKTRHLLRVCTMPDISMREQDEVMIAFTRANPDVAVKRVPLPTNQWFDAVAAGEADLCCGFYVKERMETYTQKKLAVHALRQRRKVVCVVSSKSLLTEQKRIAPEELRGYTVYAGPLLYHESGLQEFAQNYGFELKCDESAGKRYDLIDRCESGAIYIHSKGYSEDLKPLSVIPLSGFSICSVWVYQEEKSEIIDRFLQFYDALE